MPMKVYIEKCIAGEGLTTEEAAAALDLIMTNQATEAQIAGLIVALRAKGESVEEIVGFARTMREHAVKVEIDDPDAVDIVGTGGDGLGTFNISTVASFVAAGAGVTIAKHGNRAASSRTGSADLLTALGVNISAPPERVRQCINDVGIGFLFAPLFHPAMKAAAKPRSELGIKTIFNMVGPLTNPAGATRQLIGTYRDDVASKLARALRQLGTQRSCVVHGSDGIDEVALAGATRVYEVQGETDVREYAIGPDTFGLPSRPLAEIIGGDSADNATITRRVLGGEKGASRDVVLANAALGLYVAGKSASMTECRQRAEESIDSGQAMKTLERLIAFSNAP